MHNMAIKIGNQMPARTHFTELLTFSQHFSSILRLAILLRGLSNTEAVKMSRGQSVLEVR